MRHYETGLVARVRTVEEKGTTHGRRQVSNAG
jgi:hypothetical protein